MSQNDPFIQLPEIRDKRIREIPLHEFTSIPITERPLLADVRSESEWDDGHAEGAVHLSAGVIEKRIREIVPDPATPIVFYCGSGERSQVIAECLVALGFTQVAYLAGGFRAWRSAKEPVVYPACR